GIVKITTAFGSDLDIVLGCSRSDPADLDHRTGRGGIGRDDVQFDRRDLDQPRMDGLAIAEAVAQLVGSWLDRHLELQRVAVTCKIGGATWRDSVAVLEIVLGCRRADPTDVAHYNRSGRNGRCDDH